MQYVRDYDETFLLPEFVEGGRYTWENVIESAAIAEYQERSQ